MSEFYTDYHAAHAAALKRAKALGLTMCIRGGTDLVRRGYWVSGVSKRDPDYLNAELVHPGDPYSADDLKALAKEPGGRAK